VLAKEVDPKAIEILKRDAEFRNRITDICYDTWARQHPR